MKKELTDYIDGDERVLWRGKKAFWVSLMKAVFHPMLLLVLAWAAVDAVYLIGAFTKDIAASISLCSILTVHLLPLWLYFAEIVISLLRAGNTEYCVTDKAVYVQVSEQVTVRNFAGLRSVSCIRGVFDRMCGTGDIDLFFYDLVSTSGSDIRTKGRFVKKPFELSIRGVKDYEMVRHLVLELQAEANHEEDMAAWSRPQCALLQAAPSPQGCTAQPVPDPRKTEMADLIMPETGGQEPFRPDDHSGQNLPAGS